MPVETVPKKKGPGGGPGHPESLKPFHWKKGQSGNPLGRPRRKPITDRYIEAIETELPDDTRKKLGLAPGSTVGDAIARSVAFQAVIGPERVTAAKEIREAIEGKTPQAVELKHGGEVTINVRFGKRKPHERVAQD